MFPILSAANHQAAQEVEKASKDLKEAIQGCSAAQRARLRKKLKGGTQVNHTQLLEPGEAYQCERGLPLPSPKSESQK